MSDPRFGGCNCYGRYDGVHHETCPMIGSARIDIPTTTITHVFPLRRNLDIHIRGLPTDLTLKEAMRISDFLRAITIDGGEE